MMAPHHIPAVASLLFAYAQANPIANPPPGNHILLEESFAFWGKRLEIASDVGITVQRYGNHPFLGGFGGVRGDDGGNGGLGGSSSAGSVADEVKIVISSNCDTTQTTTIPHVAIKSDSIQITAGSSAKASRGTMAQDGAEAEFLESTRYQLAWTTSHCRLLQAATATSNETTTPNTTALDNYCGKTWLEAYESCSLPCPTGGECEALGDGSACQRFTTCYDRLNGEDSGVDGESEGGSSVDVLGVNAAEDANGAVSTVASFGTAVATMPAQSTQSTSSVSLSSNATIETNETGLFDAMESATPAAAWSDFTAWPENEDVSESVTASTASFDKTEPATPAAAWSDFTAWPENEDVSESITASTVMSVSSPMVDESALEANITAILTDVPNETTIPTNQTKTESNETTEINETDNQTTTKPTHAPRPSAYSPTSSPEPTAITYTPTFFPTSENSAARRGAALALLGVFGDVAGAVGAYARKLPSSTSSSTSLSNAEGEQCKYNVDIFVNECRTIHINAPTTRVIDAVLEEVSARQIGCVTNYEAELRFPEANGWILEGVVVESRC